MAGGTSGSGGVGGTGYDGQAGVDGGGGGAGGGRGGSTSGLHAHLGGAGGTAASPDGKDGIAGTGGGGGFNGNGAGENLGGTSGPLTGGAGGSSTYAVYSAGGGGGAGGYGAIATDASGSKISTAFAITGGAGGAGSSGSSLYANGGSGGDGGIGIRFVDNGLAFSNTANVTGGAGGNGGNAGIGLADGESGAGGNGGNGVVGSNFTLDNTGTIQGGNGGTGGYGYAQDAGGQVHRTYASSGAGGAGISGNGLTIDNSGMIEGGDGASGGAGIVGADLTIDNTGSIVGGHVSGVQADAVDFSGGTNTLMLGGTLVGGLGITGTLTLVTDADSTLTNVIHDGSGGPGRVEYDTAGRTLTLDAANTYSGGTKIDAGTLTLKHASKGSIDAAGSGALTLDNATLEIGVTGTLANEVDFVAAGVLGAANGTTATLTGAVRGEAARMIFGSTDETGTVVFGTGSSLLGKEVSFAAGTDTFTSGAALSISSFDIDGAMVNLASSRKYNGTFDLEAGAVNVGTSTFNLYGSTIFSGGVITGTGKLAAYGASATLDGTTTVAGQAQLIDGSRLVATADLALRKGGDLGISKKGVYDIADNVSITAATTSNTIANAGLLEKSAGKGTSVVSATITNDGTIDVERGTLDLTGAVGGSGTLGISGNAAMELGQLISSHQNMHFGPGNGHLYLDDPTRFHASTNGFNAGDTISLKGFDDHAKVLFEASQGGGGTLSVTEGSQHFSTHLAADYSAKGFSLTSSAHGETIHYTPKA